MSTRGCRKPTGAAPVNPEPDSPPAVVVGRRTRGAKAKAPAARKTKVVVTPAAKRALLKKKSTRVPKRDTVVATDEESNSSKLLEDSELLAVGSESEEEIQLQFDRLREQLARLEARQESRRRMKLKSPPVASGEKSHWEPKVVNQRADPTEGRSLGTFNGRTDLDTFLVRFETCSRHFGWSKSKRAFHLMNALTESAEPILKEVGPAGTMERILELLQNWFGNKANFEKVHADLQNRRRSRSESLQDLYLDLCRLRALASSTSDEKFPEKYFRNIFVDALNDREFRRDVLIQNPGTMEEAYRVAIQLEAIDA